ncbi:hypothetical protein BT67DRAFT_389147 [Trichocladium antarcticum]|uniref:non-specific serine/threonine protein kinase n=1 Tax=Trichocladium antarcticum TaxID=1450529 RepID=A0AAN6UEF4_9PEZI|nr:hypothetical protein BT67DRAFT_389147 [Trichocladium antarcticum]
MADQSRSEIIKCNPIAAGLDSFRVSFNAVCADTGIRCTPDALGRLDQKDVLNLALDLLLALQTHRASRLLRSSGSRKDLFGDLLQLASAVYSDDFDLDRIKPLLNAALADPLDDALIWGRVYDAVTESTPPPRPIAPSLLQTPWLRNTGSFANSSEYRKYVDNVLMEELGPIFVGLPDFHKTYFGSVQNLDTASKTFFGECLGGGNSPFAHGWRDWPQDAKQDDVLSWLADFSGQLAAFAERYDPAPAYRRRLLAQPDKPIAGSVGKRKRKLDVGFVDDSNAGKASRCDWTQILVPGELKSNLSADIPSDAWLDLGRYVREVFAAQTRRFVLGFTLCGSFMRVWAFDRLGGIASEKFDINKDGLRFVSTILGFLWMSEEELGFDPTVMTEKGQRFIEIEREGGTERLILDGLMRHVRCIAGRATTCWKAHRQTDPDTPLVVKDSWQYVERDDEGKWLCEATKNGVVRVARHYYHETVQVRDADDDVRDNVRKGLDVTKATNYRPNRSRLSPGTSSVDLLRAGRSYSAASTKRSSDPTSAFLPPSKRPCSTLPVKAGSVPNRIHRRVILSDYGVPIYKASSRETLLTALADCIEGHESLRQKAGLLHRDISIGNLMVSKDNRGFLIDLDLAIKEQRLSASGAKGKTGTRAFMAIGALLGEQHSFMHDLESFFWVLFWICIHCDGPGEGKVVAQFDKWNYADTEELAKLKLGTVSDEDIFRKTMEESFTEYYWPLVPWVNKLRKVVFPGGGRWKREDSGLYARMREILEEAGKGV